MEPPAVEDGAGAVCPWGMASSTVLGSAVNGVGRWRDVLRLGRMGPNRSSANLASDLFFTPDGVSGLSGSNVRKVRISVPVPPPIACPTS